MFDIAVVCVCPVLRVWVELFCVVWRFLRVLFVVVVWVFGGFWILSYWFRVSVVLGFVCCCFTWRFVLWVFYFVALIVDCYLLLGSYYFCGVLLLDFSFILVNFVAGGIGVVFCFLCCYIFCWFVVFVDFVLLFV